MAVEISGVGTVVAVVGKPCVVDAGQPAYTAAVSDEPQSAIVEACGYAVDVSQADASVDVVTGVIVGGIPYSGEYEADARFSEQVFPTRMRTMADDFTVRAINYTEAPNDSGITVTIGG